VIPKAPAGVFFIAGALSGALFRFESTVPGSVQCRLRSAPMPRRHRLLAHAAALPAALCCGAALAAEPLDWPALERAHAQAMQRYKAERPNAVEGARNTACQALRSAGAERAIDAPVAGVEPRRAAEILNDFGFVATAACAPWPLPERALRRALELDPHRNVAHLNLGDALRTDLVQVVRGNEDTERRRADIRREYQAFIAGGGKPAPLMASWTSAPPPLPAGSGMCGALQAWLRAGRLPELESRAAQGLVIKDRRANVTIRYEGTGLAPNVVLSDAGSGDEFDAGLGELGGDARGDAAIVSFAGRHHVLFVDRGNGGGRTVALDGGESCEVVRTRTESVEPASAEPAVCRRMLSGDGPKEVDFSTPVDLPNDELAQRWNGDLGGVQVVGSARLDVANDGRPVHVVQLTAVIRQPDACIVRLHDLLGTDGIHLASDKERRALAARGIVGDDPASPQADCYGETHYVVDGKRVLIETTQHAQGDDSRPDARSVSVDEHGQVREVCTTAFTDVWTVTPTAPEPSPR
jgi:hypothetical protein